MEIVVIVVLVVASLAAVLAPVLRRDAGAPDPVRLGGESDRGLAAAEVERELERYREAHDARTVCGRCLQANPPGSRYCSECGRPLEAAATPAPTSAKA